MANDLTKMTKKQLEKLKSDVDKALKKLSDKDMREAKKAAEKAAAKFGYTLSELAGAPAKPAGRATRKSATPKTKGVAKYANPKDPKQTWTGKGRRPAWYKAAIDAGTDPKKLEI